MEDKKRIRNHLSKEEKDAREVKIRQHKKISEDLFKKFWDDLKERQSKVTDKNSESESDSDNI